MATEERVVLTMEQAEAMLPDGDDIHTFRDTNGRGPLIGADWSRANILEALRTKKPELSGELATKMDHGIVFFDEYGPVFVATKPQDGK